jgi:glycosyltransferase involved in cell wall biosynthesis
VPDDRVLVMAVSRLTPEKGLDVLVDAVARVPDGRRPILAVGGAGPVRSDIEARAAGRGIEVRMLGEVAPDELPDFLGAADIVAHASRQGTNVPVAILEAMACARLVVATDQPPAAHELLGDARGIVVPAGDLERFADALDAAVAMPDGERQAAGEAARRWVEREHGPDRIDEELARALSLDGARSAGTPAR